MQQVLTGHVSSILHDRDRRNCSWSLRAVPLHTGHTEECMQDRVRWGGHREETGTGDNRMDGYSDSCCSTFVSLESLSCLPACLSVYLCLRLLQDYDRLDGRRRRFHKQS